VRLKLLTSILMVVLVSAACGCRKESSNQETIHISFLQKDAPLASTVKFLEGHGSREDALVCFAEAVKHYNLMPPSFDLSRFPHAVDGDFTFESVTQLIASLPYKLRETPHPFEFNCYDTVILLTSDELKTDRMPDDIFGVSLAPAIGTNDQLMLLPVSTARDAFMWSCPSWYQTASQSFFPKSTVNSRINLTAALYGFYVLPSSTRSTNLAEKVLQTLRSNWNRQGVLFPRNSEVVLCHEVHSAKNSVATFHAGLLLKRAGGYTYIEKDSGCGPFVRLDFAHRSALLPWLAAKGDRHEMDGPNNFFVTFNDGEIEELNVEATSTHQITRLLSEPNQRLQETSR
jgi:hypothetical protein